MPEPIPVLHLLGDATRDNRAQAEIVRFLARGLRPAYDIRAAFLGADGPLRQRLADEGVSAFWCGWNGRFRSLPGLKRFADVLKTGPAIIHQHFGGARIRIASSAMTRAEVVVHLHGRVIDEENWRLATIRPHVAGAVVATSAAVARAVSVRGGRVTVAYPAVELPSLGEGRTGEFVIGTACRLVPIKGVDRLLRAFVRVVAPCPRARLEIAGDGPERSRLEALAKDLGIAAHVEFRGWTDDPISFMRRLSLFVAAPHEEAFGLAILEAMACAKPIVATAVGGIPELVDDSCGILVPPNDCDALAGAITTLLLDPELRRVHGMNARERAASFSPDRLTGTIATVYESLDRRRAG